MRSATDSIVIGSATGRSLASKADAQKVQLNNRSRERRAAQPRHRERSEVCNEKVTPQAAVHSLQCAKKCVIATVSFKDVAQCQHSPFHCGVGRIAVIAVKPPVPKPEERARSRRACARFSI